MTTASKVPSLRNDKRAEWKKCTALYGRVGFSFFGFREIGRGIVLRSFEVCNFEPFLEWLFCSLAKVFGVGVRRIKWKTLRIRGHIWHNLPAMQETDCRGKHPVSLVFNLIRSSSQSCQEWLLPTAGRAHDLQWYRCWRWMCEGPLTGHVRLLSFSATIVSVDSYVPLNCPIIQKLIWLWDV